MVMVDDKIYVAVTGKDLENKSSLVWAIQNTGGKDFCIVYVHQPIQISLQGAMFNNKKLPSYKQEKEKAHKNLDKYLEICREMEVNAEKICIEMDSVEKVIIRLICQRGVRKLVIGAAADKHYSMRMKDLQSEIAIYIQREAHVTCHIWFTCNGYLICTREAGRRENLYLECTLSTSLSQSEITRGAESVPTSSIIKVDDQIKVALVEAENSKREARIEASKCEEAEKHAIDTIEKARKSENVHIDELKQMKEIEKALRKEIEELKINTSESETRIIESNMVMKWVRLKYSLAVQELTRILEEQEELKINLREVSSLKSNRKNDEPPQYFICPITQDVMKDPHVAADGFTYEGKSISGWFERGHRTSPMTNKRLPHQSLVPNPFLRSAIQEWLEARNS